MLIAGTTVAEPLGDPFDGKALLMPARQTLSPQEVMLYALPYRPAVAQCYRRHVRFDRRATGDLELYVVIARSGKVVYSAISAPGVSASRALSLERCLKTEISTWRFPARSGFTNVVLPYFIPRMPTSGDTGSKVALATDDGGAR